MRTGNDRVLFISPVPTDPATAGNRRRIVSLLEMLEALDCDFRFLWFAQESGDTAAMQSRWGERLITTPIECRPRYASGWRRIRNGVYRRLFDERDHPLQIDAFRDERLGAPIQAAAAKFQPTCVLVAYVFWSWILDLFPPAVRKVIDTHDVMGDRHKRFRQAGVAPEWIFTTPREERRGLERADFILPIQDHE